MIKLTTTQLDRLIATIPIATFLQIDYEVQNKSNLSNIEFDLLVIFLKHGTSLSMRQLSSIIELEMSMISAGLSKVEKAIQSLQEQRILSIHETELTFIATRPTLLCTSSPSHQESGMEVEIEKHVRMLALLSEELKQRCESLRVQQLVNNEKDGSMLDFPASDTQLKNLPPNPLPFFARPPASALPPPSLEMLTPHPSSLPVPNFVAEAAPLEGSNEATVMQSEFGMRRYNK